MKIATWNLDQHRRTASKWARQLRHIENLAADVWVLTETYRDLAPGAGYELVACSGEAPDRVRPDGRWVAVWCRRELSGKAIELPADRERCAAVELANGIVVVGTVLPWLGDTQQHPLSGSEAFRARLTEQAADWKLLRSATGGRV